MADRSHVIASVVVVLRSAIFADGDSFDKLGHARFLIHQQACRHVTMALAFGLEHVVVLEHIVLGASTKEVLIREGEERLELPLLIVGCRRALAAVKTSSHIYLSVIDFIIHFL